ncbi:MAG: hypothetical protein ACC661_03190 [Verrucomicrobiales bacterium]
MQQRLILALGLIVPWVLSSCYPFVPPPEEDPFPYGPPRYGHQGTSSSGGANAHHPPPAGTVGANANANAGANANAAAAQPGAPATPGAPGTATGGTEGAPGSATPAPGTAPATPPASHVGASPTGAAGSGGGATAAAGGDEVPYGIPVPGKDGMLYSPFSPDAGFIDITTRAPDGSTTVLPPGTKIKDPFSGKAILVP